MMRIFSSLRSVQALIVVAITFTMVACSSDDKIARERIEPAGGTSGQGEPSVTPSRANMKGRDLEYARHLIFQIGEVRRLMDAALNLKPYTRMSGHHNEIDDCRTLTRADFDASVETKSEKFFVKYRNCKDVSDASVTGVKQSRVLKGTETFQLEYETPFPKPDDVDPKLGLPLKVQIDSSDVAVQFFLADPADKLVLNRGFTFTAVKENEIWDWDSTITYLVTFKSSNTIQNMDVGAVIRSGSFSTELPQVILKVHKETRQIVSVRLSDLNMYADLYQRTKDVERGTLSVAMPIEFAGYALRVRGDVRVNGANPCDAPEGTFTGSSGPFANQVVGVTASAGNIWIDGIGTVVPLRICDSANDNLPLYADHMGTVLLFDLKGDVLAPPQEQDTESTPEPTPESTPEPTIEQ